MEEYTETPTKGKAILQFSAAWCGPCRVLKPRLEALVDESPNLLGTLVDVDKHPHLVEKFGIKSVPTVVLLEDGEEVSRHTGHSAYEAVKAFAK